MFSSKLFELSSYTSNIGGVLLELYSLLVEHLDDGRLDELLVVLAVVARAVDDD